MRLDYERLQKVDELSFKVGVTTFPWVVWTKLTTARELRRWWASSPTIELEEGGVFCFDDSRLGPRNVAGIEEGIRLGLDWQWTIDETSHIEWRIEETDDETVVSVVDASPPPEGMERTRRAIYLASMTLYLAQMSAQGVSPMEYQDPWSRPSGPGFP